MCFDPVAPAAEQIALGHLNGKLLVKIIPLFINQPTHADSFFFWIAVIEVEQKLVSFYTFHPAF